MSDGYECPRCGKEWAFGNCATTVSRRARCALSVQCSFRCPCHQPEWCADDPTVGCDLCAAWHGQLKEDA